MSELIFQVRRSRAESSFRSREGAAHGRGHVPLALHVADGWMEIDRLVAL